MLFRSLRVLFGHWAALEGRSPNRRIHALDTGYVWGRRLTALNLDDERLVSVVADSRLDEAVSGALAAATAVADGT